MSDTPPIPLEIEDMARTLRACLVHAYHQGVADGAVRLLRDSGVPVVSSRGVMRAGQRLRRSDFLAALADTTATAGEIAAALGTNRQNANTHLQNLRKAGLVARVGHGLFRRIPVQPEGGVS